VDWINLAQVGDQWRALRDLVMNYFNAIHSVRFDPRKFLIYATSVGTCTIHNSTQSLVHCCMFRRNSIFGESVHQYLKLTGVHIPVVHVIRTVS